MTKLTITKDNLNVMIEKIKKMASKNNIKISIEEENEKKQTATKEDREKFEALGGVLSGLVPKNKSYKEIINEARNEHFSKKYNLDL